MQPLSQHLLNNPSSSPKDPKFFWGRMSQPRSQLALWNPFDKVLWKRLVCASVSLRLRGRPHLGKQMHNGMLRELSEDAVLVYDTGEGEELIIPYIAPKDYLEFLLQNCLDLVSGGGLHANSNSSATGILGCLQATAQRPQDLPGQQR